MFAVESRITWIARKWSSCPKLLVDPGSDHNTRNIGFAIIRLDKYFTIDEVVFAEKGMYRYWEREHLKD